ncbi:MAG TPA: short chain dehydrogenase [Longimicrobium sp.]|nr:short chain dehydrogenase [Longimicrobium sp.]
MKVVVIGATGTIGRAVAGALEGKHEVVRVARTEGDLTADIEDAPSLVALFAAVGPVDAVVCCAGRASFKPLEQLAEPDFHLGLNSKLMGQVNLVRLGLKHVRDGGSFTLTSGVLAWEPMPGGAAISPVNAAVEAFARAAALEMPRGIRVNVVSPPWVSETLRSMGQDPSHGMPADQLAHVYVEAVEGTRNGETLDARKFA